ncbi:hypothetical protein KJ756_03330 [Patescibacteria group bacterium]|nr:hypothetical protein [Patescibacteria group bacterium]MCG2701046.1 hypothetical protein [Candidatus Parcubacteria bacterium]MCG2809358.1 hypothetical protein [Candidatus Portnoybacteria bacterium]MBU2579379.1 hypothetical protein [Patescibacteria group bacterium]MBU4031163.1 hypothetical protein [Patescibacteria group bacterium]
MVKINKKSKGFRSEKIKSAIKNLPYFRIENLTVIEENKKYLRILLSRLSKKGEVISLKKGVYVSKKYLEFIEKSNGMNEYLEFIANILYEPAYISLEYALGKNNILSETSNSFTLITEKKTKKFSNKLGLFDYHHIKENLFIGFELHRKGEYLIKKASLAKALFDFLYLRKNILRHKTAVKELRLNLGDFRKKDIKELEKYVKLESSKKMTDIFNYLFKSRI